MVEVLGIGNPFFDRVAYVENIPEGLTKGGAKPAMTRKEIDETWESVSTGQPYEWILGGSCPNVIKTLAGLGIKSALLGVLGKDRQDDVQKRLNTLGIESFLKVVEEDSGCVNCFVTTGGERTMHTFLGSSTKLTADDIQERYFENIQHVHLEGYLIYGDEKLEKVIDLALKTNKTVSLDLASVDAVLHEGHKERFLDAARRVHYLFGNLQEMQKLTDETEINAILIKINAPDTTIIVTNGAQGGWVKQGQSNKLVSFEALRLKPEQVVDTTGAGDFFSAGFLYGILKRLELTTCIAIANLAACSVIGQEGADLSEEGWSGLRTNVEILAGGNNANRAD